MRSLLLAPACALVLGLCAYLTSQPQAESVKVRLKLVDAAGRHLVKDEAGWLVTADGSQLETSDTVRVRGGALEGSNVRAVEEMVAVMDLSRQFEVQMKLFKAADSMADAGNRLVRD